MLKTEVTEIKVDLYPVPESYKGRLSDGRTFYFRNMDGVARLRVSMYPTDSYMKAVSGDSIWAAKNSKHYKYGKRLVEQLINKALEANTE